MALHPRLPPEICASICGEVAEAGDLALLCRTSRLFQNQAQRILYHTVDLQGGRMRSLKSWCLSVTRHSHLAERVHTLSLLIPRGLEVPVAIKIGRALSRCVNLKELTTSGEAYDANGPRTVGIYGWMINECPFRLIKFANSYFSEGSIKEFWNAQSEIRVLLLPYLRGIFPCSDKQLPNLIAAGSPSLYGLPAGRVLQRIETGFRHTQLEYSSLVQYARTLTTLNLLREWPDRNVTILDALISIADLLPRLSHLGIVELKKNPYTLVEHTPVLTFQKFLRLETFVLHVRTVAQFKDPNSDLIYEMDAAADLEALGSAIMMACPTLRRTAMGAEAKSDQELTCVLTRLHGGGIHSEAGTELDFDAVSMFWDP
ncbi:hypothetical protein C8R44DRAFT_241262 [Mycena epipterygia]|nr:hypothetical protein C8R44DRAFT_241262 [Mycena epipterygia]